MPSKLDTMISESYNNNMLTRKTNSVSQQRGWNAIAFYFPLIVYSLRKLIPFNYDIRRNMTTSLLKNDYVIALKEIQIKSSQTLPILP